MSVRTRGKCITMRTIFTGVGIMFKVMLRYGRGPETQSGTTFKTLDEARAHFNKEIQKAVMMKSNAIYRLYDFDDVIEEKDTSKMDVSQLPRDPDEASSSSQGQGNASRFSPTPLSTSLKPKGATSNWKDEDKDKK